MHARGDAGSGEPATEEKDVRMASQVTRRQFLAGATGAAATALVLPHLSRTGTALGWTPLESATLESAATESYAREKADAQSPIDIITANVTEDPRDPVLVVDYPTSVDLTVFYVSKDTRASEPGEPGCSLRDPSETIEAHHFSQPAFVVYDREPYQLVQFHFHTASEHRVNGAGAPLEQHFVHAKVADPSQLLVVGLFLRGGGSGTPQDRVLTTLPPECPLTEVHVNGVDLRGMMPGSDLKSYRYGGSLTTPPFDEGVRWHVLRSGVSIDPATIGRFQQLFPQGNARPTQPMGARKIRLAAGRFA